MVEAGRFREVMGHFASGVTVVTARDGENMPVGLTVSAFTSVSLEPTLLLICVHTGASPHDAIIQGGTFAVNILSDDQGPLAYRFADATLEERFKGMEFRSGPLGNPLIPDCLGWLECRVREVWPGGDHSVILAEVESCEARSGPPLLYFRGGLERMSR